MRFDYSANRSELLDCIRATAVTLVVVFHVATRYPVAEIDAVGRWFLRYGYLGVDIFFPLSGYLITRFLLRRPDRPSVLVFYMRRLFRIVPLYLVAVTLYLIAALITGIDDTVRDRIWVTYLFLTGWFAFTGGPDSIPYTITWSLSVEEFAYLLFGFTALIFRGRFFWFLLFYAAAPFMLRLWLYAGGYDNIYYFPLARLDSIAMGGVLAACIGGGLRRAWLWFGAAALAALLISQLGNPLGKASLFMQVTLMTCFVIALCEELLPGHQSAPARLYARVGLYSYFIYLFHFFALYGAQQAEAALNLSLPFWPMTAVVYAGTFVAAWASFKLFEGPIISFGRGLERTAPAKPAPQPQA